MTFCSERESTAVLEGRKAVDIVTILKDTYTNVSQIQGSRIFEWHIIVGCFP